jgi:hypothetical protein
MHCSAFTVGLTYSLCIKMMYNILSSAFSYQRVAFTKFVHRAIYSWGQTSVKWNQGHKIFAIIYSKIGAFPGNSGFRHDLRSVVCYFLANDPMVEMLVHTHMVHVERIVVSQLEFQSRPSKYFFCGNLHFGDGIPVGLAEQVNSRQPRRSVRACMAAYFLELKNYIPCIPIITAVTLLIPTCFGNEYQQHKS